MMKSFYWFCLSSYQSVKAFTFIAEHGSTSNVFFLGIFDPFEVLDMMDFFAVAFEPEEAPLSDEFCDMFSFICLD